MRIKISHDVVFDLNKENVNFSKKVNQDVDFTL